MATVTLTRAFRWTNRKLRTCRTLHRCRLCKEDITAGQQYRDGGYGERAHEEPCVREWMERNAKRLAHLDGMLSDVVEALRERGNEVRLG